MVVKKSSPSWIDVKTALADFDRPGLLALVQDLYTASKDNQTFLHARFALGEDVLKPYKTALNRWLWPDAFKNHDTSVTKAKKAISDYRKAIGQPEVRAFVPHPLPPADPLLASASFADLNRRRNWRLPGCRACRGWCRQ